MPEITDGMILYHASYAVIDKIDLKKGRQGLDFGKGFYVTSSYEQAHMYIPQAVKKARRIGAVSADFSDEDGIINVYRVHLDTALRTHCFEEADVSWLHFVSANRDQSLFPNLLEEYDAVDIIGGKVANDNTARTLQLYIIGAYGTPGDVDADEYTVKLLLPNRLRDQFCFRTEKAIENLEFLRGERYGNIRK